MATNIENLETDEDLDEFSLLLTTFPHVVAVILSYLNAQDLNRCSRVCILWSKVAKNLKKHRKTRAWTCFSHDDAEEGQGIADKMKEFICNLYSEPKTVFMFCQSDFYESSICSAHSSDKVYGGFGGFVKCCLPSDCTLIGVSAGGVVGTSSDLNQIYEIEQEEGVAILCLPEYNDVSFISEIIDETEGRFAETAADLFPSVNPNECKAVFTFISSMEVSRLFGFDLVDVFSSSLVAGGYVDNIIWEDNEEFKAVQCAALYGDNVKVASVIIKTNIDSPSQVEEIVKKLKSHNLSEKKSFAFMFACVGRGAGLYGEPNVESSIFKKHFPNTPLFGFFGNGEFGFDFISGTDRKSEETPEKKKRKSQPKLYHSYTTVLVLVSIK